MDEPERPAGAGAPGAGRRECAAALRARRAEIGRAVAGALGARWRAADIGVDLTSGVVADECERLAATLALAVQVDNPALFGDQIEWLAGILAVRNYDAAAIIPRILDAYAAACAPVGAPEALAAFVRPVLDETRARAAAGWKAPPAPSAGEGASSDGG